MVGLHSILYRLMVVSFVCFVWCVIGALVILDRIPKERINPVMDKMMYALMGTAAFFGVTCELLNVYDAKPMTGLRGMLWRGMLSLDYRLRGSELALKCEDSEA